MPICLLHIPLPGNVNILSPAFGCIYADEISAAMPNKNERRTSMSAVPSFMKQESY